MPKVNFITAENEIVIDAPSDSNLMKVAVKNDVPGIVGECGGEMTCATCHVHLTSDWLSRVPERDDEEVELLEVVDDFCSSSRLGCQVKITDDLDGLTVRVPSNQ